MARSTGLEPAASAWRTSVSGFPSSSVAAMCDHLRGIPSTRSALPNRVACHASTALFVFGPRWAGSVAIAPAVAIAQTFAALTFATWIPASISGWFLIGPARSAFPIRLLRLTWCSRHSRPLLIDQLAPKGASRRHVSNGLPRFQERCSLTPSKDARGNSRGFSAQPHDHGKADHRRRTSVRPRAAPV